MNGSLRWKLIAGVLLAFLAGGMSGFFFATHAQNASIEFHQQGLVSTRMKEHLRRQLNLTPEQETKISPIVEKMAGQLEEVRSETGARVRKTMQDAHHEIAAFLTDEQKKELGQMEERHRTWHVHHGMHPSPDGETPRPSP